VQDARAKLFVDGAAQESMRAGRKRAEDDSLDATAAAQKATARLSTLVDEGELGLGANLVQGGIAAGGAVELCDLAERFGCQVTRSANRRMAADSCVKTEQVPGGERRLAAEAGSAGWGAACSAAGQAFQEAGLR